MLWQQWGCRSLAGYLALSFTTSFLAQHPSSELTDTFSSKAVLSLCLHHRATQFQAPLVPRGPLGFPPSPGPCWPPTMHGVGGAKGASVSEHHLGELALQ